MGLSGRCELTVKIDPLKSKLLVEGQIAGRNIWIDGDVMMTGDVVTNYSDTRYCSGYLAPWNGVVPRIDGASRLRLTPENVEANWGSWPFNVGMKISDAE